MVRRSIRASDDLYIEYNEDRWRLLKKLREEAIKLMEIFNFEGVDSVVHGSLARGDVTEKSDIDLFLPNPPSSFKIETTLAQVNIGITRRFIVQATPRHVLKGYLEFGENEVVSFPLSKMTDTERGFYRFSGEINLEELKLKIRKFGIDKRLMLITPTVEGHIESSIIGNEEEVAKLLEISPKAVFDRVYALLRRDKVGRTGVFIEKVLNLEENFEMAVKRLAETKPEVRRRLKFLKR